MKKVMCFAVIATLCTLAFAEYKPNGDPLYVSAGAVPLEPNTDKLPHALFQKTEYHGKPLTIIATNKKDFDKGVSLLSKDAQVEFDPKMLHVFYLHGDVPARKAKGLGVGKVPVTMICQVFGIERSYIKKANVTSDIITIYIVAHDRGANKAMQKHNPGFYFKIDYESLDTEFNATPPITKNTKFIVSTMQASSGHEMFPYKGKVAKK